METQKDAVGMFSTFRPPNKSIPIMTDRLAAFMSESTAWQTMGACA